MTRFFKCLCGIVLFLQLPTVCSAQFAKGCNYRTFFNRRPPELVSAASHWINSREQLTLEKLRGNVVWLQFNF
jgi:hypothetical protein